MTTTVLAYIPSPSQGVWHLGVIPLRAYALFIILGIVVALLIGDRRWVARGGEPGVIYDIAIPAVIFGLIGGRLYHVMTDWRTYFGDDGAGLMGALRIWDGGLGIWGAVALGGVGAWIGCRGKGIPLPAFGDAIAPGIVLAQAIGRLGNYFNQELYGRPTTLPWGLEIYERRDASGALDSLNGVSTGHPLIPGVEAVHPTFLYELLWNVLVFAALIWIDKRFTIGHGRLFAMYVAGYCLGRFWIELMRSDHATTIADTGIRINSFTSTFVFIGAVVYIMVAPKGREDPASLAGKPEKEDEVEDAVEVFAKELTAVAATTGVVAAAKVAGDAEDEDAKAAVEDVEDITDEPEDEEVEAKPETEAEAEEPEADEGDTALAAEDLAPDVASDEEDALAAEELADEGEAEDEEPEAEDEEPEAEAENAELEAEAENAELEAEAEDEEPELKPEDPELKPEEPELKPEEPDAEAAPEAGLGVVEGEEAVEAQEAAPEVHEAAVEAADEAGAVAEELAAEDEEPLSEAAAESADEADEAEDDEPEADKPESEDEADAEPADETEEPEAEDDDEADAEPADEAGEPKAEDDDEADAEPADEAGEPDAEDDDDDALESDESETEDAEAAVEADEAEPSEEQAAEEAEAVVEEADSAADEEPTTGVLETTAEPAAKPEPAAPADETGGRLSRWLRRRR